MGLKEVALGIALSLPSIACTNEADIRQRCAEIGRETNEKTSRALVGTGASDPILTALWRGEEAERQCSRVNNPE